MHRATGQGLPGVGIGIPLPGIGIPINILADYPNPYANKAPAYRSAYLFRSSELQELSHGKPMAIRSIFFEVSIPQRALLQHYTIRMKQVPWNEMQNPIPDGGFTEVYWPKTFVETSGFNEHVFDVPFCWDGTSNFIIDICVQNLPEDKSFNATVKSSTPDNSLKTSYHDWNNTGNPICLMAERVQPALYTKRPLTYFAAIPADSTDLRMFKIFSPGDLVDAGQTHDVKVRFQNYSCPTVNGVKLGYQFNSDPPVIEDYNLPLAPGEYVDYTYAKKLEIPDAQFGVLKMWTQHPDDKYAANDTITYLVFVKDSKFGGLDYSGDDFWIAFMQNYANQGINQIVFITSTNNTTAHVGVPLLGWDTTVTITANQVLGVPVPLVVNGTVTATEPSEVVSRTGVHVTADDEISVYGYSGQALSTDGYLAVPRRTLGRSYTVYAPTGIYQPLEVAPLLINAPAEFIVVGTEDNTLVTIVPSQPTAYHPKGDTIRVTLNRGETYLVKAKVESTSLLGITTYSTTYDLTGTQVTADKKIGLIGGSMCAYIPGMTSADKCESCDHLLEMLLPPHSWGREFYTTDFEFKPGDDVIRLINGDSVNASVDFNGTTYLIAPRDFRDVKFQGEVYIRADRPIQAVQMCTGGQCTVPSSPTDPFISNMIPEVQWGNYYTFTTPTTPNLTLHYINIVKKSAQARVGFDGYILRQDIFKKIGNTDYYITKMPVTMGIHKVSGDSILFVNVYGFGRDNSYGYPASGSMLKVFNIPPIEITGVKQDIKCFGAKNGHIKVEGSGGTAPYVYYWNDGASGPERSNLDTGKYWVFVEDDYGYRDTAFFTITQPDSLAVSITRKDITCYGAANGEAHALATGGTKPYQYKWTDGPTTADRTGLSPGTYIVEVTDSNKCTARDTVILVEPPQVLLELTPVDPRCFNGKDGVVRSTVTNGIPPLKYTWQNFPAVTADSLINLSPGGYALQVTDSNGCRASASTTLRNPAEIKTSVTSTGIPCFGSANGNASVTATGGRGNFTFRWNTTPPVDSAYISGLSKGWYFVSVSDGFCTVKDSAFIDSINSPVFTVASVTATCDKPTGTATASASGGTGNYSYRFNTSPVQTGNSATKLAPGNYTVTVSDGFCQQNMPFSIGNVPGPRFNVNKTDLSCNLNNGTATLDSLRTTGNFSIKWLTSPVQNNVSSIDSLKAGTYSVEVKDSVCTVAKSFTLVTVPQPRITSVTKTQPDCDKNNGKLVVTTTGGGGPLQITWNTVPPRYGASIDSLFPGSYTASITDGVCTTQTVASLSSKNGPKIFFFVTEPKCDEKNGKIVASVSGGSGTYTYTWNGDTTRNTKTLDSIPAGSYSLLVDDGTCKSGLDTVLKGSPKPTVNLNAYQPKCGLNNGSVKANVVVAKPNYTQYWNGVAGTDSLYALAAGKYVYSVFDGVCWGTDSVVLTTNPPMVAQVTQIDSAACGSSTGTATIAISGGGGVYAISWNTTPEQTGTSASLLAAGTYVARYTDFECSDSISVIIPERIKPVVSSSSTPEHCDRNDGRITVSPSSGTAPFTITWDKPGVSGFSPAAMDSGWYRFTVNDQYCSSRDSAHISFVSPPVIVTDSVTPAHCGLNNGIAYTSVSGTTGSYSINWNSSPAQSGPVAANLPGGTFRAIVSDQFCSDTTVAVIPVVPLMQLSAVSQTPATCALPNATLKIKASGGSGPYRYAWNAFPLNQSDSASGLPGGWAVYRVSDNYCTITDSTLINTVTKPVVNAITSGPEWCGRQNGWARVTVRGGSGSYTYNWPGVPNGSTDNISQLSGGKYTVQITDGNCTITDSVNVGYGYAPYGELTVVRNESCNQQNGEARLANLNPSTSTVDWNNTGYSGPVYSNLAAGAYTVKLSNQYCDTLISFRINTIAPPQLVVTAFPDTCHSGRGRLVWSVQGGTSPYRYAFNGVGMTANYKTALAEGVYTVSVSDANNCQSANPANIGNVNLEMPGGRIDFSPQDPIPGDQLILTTHLPSGWSQTGWAVNGNPEGNAKTLTVPTAPVEQTLEVALFTRHYTGCIDSLYSRIRLEEQYYIYIPSSFTPDNDGYNELFFPVTVGIKDVEGSIYNRWGEAIFTFHSLEDRWNGLYKGELVKTDTYVFRLIFTTNKGKKVEEFGKVTLLK
ncbi:MAG: T9SS type B sorting domain-containing protein [Bacteroidota bacterium]